MRTLVFQSFRNYDVPLWITQCMDTVRQWAAYRDFDYHLLGDELFDGVPDYFRQRVSSQVVQMSDLGRLDWARSFLKAYERVIWVDADIAIFHSAAFDIVVDREFAFCSEVWVGLDQQRRLRGYERVNNAVSVYVRGNSFLDFYYYACLKMAKNEDCRLGKLSFGTDFLSYHHRMLKLQLLENVGMISPLMLQDLVKGGTDTMGSVYQKYIRSPMAAGNLCASFRNQSIFGLQMHDEIYHGALQHLMATQGAVINRHITQTVDFRGR